MWTLLLILPAGLASALETPSVTVDYQFRGSSGFQGAFEGSCLSNGVILPPLPAYHLDSGGGTLVLRHTRINWTEAAGTTVVVDQTAAPDRQWTEEITVPAGPIRLAPDASGHVVPMAYGPTRGVVSPFPISLLLSHANLTPVNDDLPMPVPAYFVDEAGAVRIRNAVFPGMNRLLDGDGAATMNGNVTFYLRQAALDFQATRTETGPYEVEEARTGQSPIVRRTLLYRDAFLDLESVTWRLPSGARIACERTDGFLDGAYRAELATGRGINSTTAIDFEDQLLTLSGRFALEEKPAESGSVAIVGRAAGRIEVLGIDFVPALSPGGLSGTTVAALGFGALLVAGLLAAKNMGQFVGIFYSRFGPDRILENPNRDLVYRAVVGNPGIDLSRLVTLVPLHLTTIQYHVQVLQRVGLVNTVRHGRSLRVVPKELNNVPGVAQVLAAHDERFSFIVSQVQPGPLPLREVAERVQRQFGITRRGAYQAIQRALARNIVRREGEGKGGWISCPT